MNHEPIPSHHPVQPLGEHEPAESKATCGHCGLSWDDGKATSLTPAPSGRCPFEPFHLYGVSPMLSSKEISDLAIKFSSVRAGRPDSNRQRNAVIAQLYGDTPERTAFNFSVFTSYVDDPFYRGILHSLLSRNADYIDAGCPTVEQLLREDEND